MKFLLPVLLLLLLLLLLLKYFYFIIIIICFSIITISNTFQRIPVIQTRCGRHFCLCCCIKVVHDVSDDFIHFVGSVVHCTQVRKDSSFINHLLRVHSALSGSGMFRYWYFNNALFQQWGLSLPCDCCWCGKHSGNYKVCGVHSSGPWSQDKSCSRYKSLTCLRLSRYFSTTYVKWSYLLHELCRRVKQGRLVYFQELVYGNSSFVIWLLHFCSCSSGKFF